MVRRARLVPNTPDTERRSAVDRSRRRVALRVDYASPLPATPLFRRLVRAFQITHRCPRSLAYCRFVPQSRRAKRRWRAAQRSRGELCDRRVGVHLEAVTASEAAQRADCPRRNDEADRRRRGADVERARGRRDLVADDVGRRRLQLMCFSCEARDIERSRVAEGARVGPRHRHTEVRAVDVKLHRGDAERVRRVRPHSQRPAREWPGRRRDDRRAGRPGCPPSPGSSSSRSCLARR